MALLTPKNAAESNMACLGIKLQDETGEGGRGPGGGGGGGEWLVHTPHMYTYMPYYIISRPEIFTNGPPIIIYNLMILFSQFTSHFLPFN